MTGCTPDNRTPSLWPITLGLCAVALVMAWAFRSTEQTVPAKEQTVPAPTQPPQTVVLHAVLEIPTPAPTPIPTLEPTPYTKRVTINECGTATPGATCEWPNPTPLPPTPFPLCGPEMKGGYTCQWPTEAAP